jgi:putative sterol carrier protein
LDDDSPDATQFDVGDVHDGRRDRGASRRAGGGTTVSDTTAAFFDELAQRGYEPRAATMRGSVRLDLRRGKRIERWLVSVDRGTVTVSRANAAADAVVRTDETLFEDLVRGEANAMAALLRGALTIEGDAGLLLLFQRLLGPATPRRKPSGASREESTP